ncbi:hypothetical protein CPB84DRAFT_1709637 [Gymnopilus junonius]|uniref:Putative gamma-glutamylcyclotransferase n=1 Tax=Gymnopilus junonius TaxID=109634 RepID=A0A9P5NPG2_GYMJU|nr:hypothetical protein CPB84DRAFT_1709637 [Gymnopilus junonius]
MANQTNQPTPRPLFLYGTLRALQLLACVLTSDPEELDQIRPLIQPAILRGYSCVSIVGKEFPALVVVSDDTNEKSLVHVDGLLLRPQTDLQRRKIHDFMGSAFKVIKVEPLVILKKKEHGVQIEEKVKVDADVYLWNGHLELVKGKPWSFTRFERENLAGWLEIYSGMTFST